MKGARDYHIAPLGHTKSAVSRFTVLWKQTNGAAFPAFLAVGFPQEVGTFLYQRHQEALVKSSVSGRVERFFGAFKVTF